MLRWQSAAFLVAELLLLAVGVASQTVLKSDTACHRTTTTTACSHHRLECDAGRVFILQALRGTKRSVFGCNMTSLACPSEPGICCRHNDGDCLEAWAASDFQELYKECWGKESCRYAVPEHRSVSCGEGFQNVSTYSEIHYVCLTGSSITAFQWRTPVRGRGVMAEFRDSASDGGQTRVLSCRVDSVRCSPVSTSVLLYRGGNPGCRSGLPFSSLFLNGVRHFGCSEAPSYSSIDGVSTPFSVAMETAASAPVTEAWALVYTDGEDTDELSLTCGYRDLSLTSAPCPPPDCYTLDEAGAARYWGRGNNTVSGRGCQRWDSQTPHSQSRWRRVLQLGARDLASQHNFCRDTDQEGALWCYTSDPDVRWEQCNVTSCSDVPFPTTTQPESTTTSPITTTTTTSTTAAAASTTTAAREGTPTDSSTEMVSVSSNSSEQSGEHRNTRPIIVGGVVAAAVVLVVVLLTSVIAVVACFKCRRSPTRKGGGMVPIFNPSYALHVPDAVFCSTVHNPVYGIPDSLEDTEGPEYVNVSSGADFSPELELEDSSGADFSPELKLEDSNDVDYNRLGQSLTSVVSSDVTYSHLTDADDVEYAYDHPRGNREDSSCDVMCNVYDVPKPTASRLSDVYVNYDVMEHVESDGLTNT